MVVIYAVLHHEQRIIIAFQTSSDDCASAIRILGAEQFVAQDAVIVLCCRVNFLFQVKQQRVPTAVILDEVSALVPHAVHNAEAANPFLQARCDTFQVADLRRAVVRSVSEGEMS